MANLKKLVRNVEEFFQEFKQYDLVSISEKKVSELLGTHQPTIDDVCRNLLKNQNNCRVFRHAPPIC